MLKKGILFIAGFFILSLCLQAQESPVIENRSTTIHNIDGKEYFFHAVLPKQTLFSIAKAYGVSVDDIIRENPELRNQPLRFDQIIRIPVKQHASESNQPRSSTIEETIFTQHKVRRRETVYGISRLYDITESELLEHNPQARSGLKTNMVLRIPRTKQTLVYFKEYVVMPQQTLFSISREFGVSISQLEELNPELKNGLKAGQVLRIPVENVQHVQPPFVDAGPEEELDTEPEKIPQVIDPYCSDPEIKSHYNVALLIPLYLENMDEEGFISPEARNQSFAFVEYYEGMMIALDSIRARGADIRLSVYDVDESEVKARAAIWKPEMANMDLIIGPFFPKVFPVVADFAKDKNIPIVSPLHSDDKELLRKYPHMFQVTPDLQTQLDNMAEYIVDHFPNENIVVVHNNQPGVINLIESHKHALNQGLNRYVFARDSANMAELDGYFLNGVYVGERKSNVYVINDSLWQKQEESGSISDMEFSDYEKQDFVSEIVYSRDGMDVLKTTLDSNKRNVVVSLMGGEATIANYTRQLSQLRDTFDLVVFGVPQWRDYNSIDTEYLQYLETHIFSTDFIDYEKEYNLDFIRRYRAANYVEPGVMGFRATETGIYFFTALMQYGAQFYRCMEFINQSKSYNSPFIFQKPYASGGYENQFVYIYRYEDYTIRDVRETKEGMATRDRP